MDKHFYVYILASGKHGTIYIGVTNDLIRRVHEHKEKRVPGFTKEHGVDKVVYYESSTIPRWQSFVRSVSSAGSETGR